MKNIINNSRLIVFMNSRSLLILKNNNNINNKYFDKKS